ncbi:hypothetical protein QQ045_002010 [Rhodiola kirilowii]
MVALWIIWFNRNAVVHGKISMSPFLAGKRILRLYKDFMKNNKTLSHCLNNNNLNWQKPKGIYCKVNCDASWNSEDRSGGIGIVVRDSSSIFLAINAQHIPYCNSVLECEGFALREGMRVARRLRLEHVLFETDCKELALRVNCMVKQDLWSKAWFDDICESTKAHLNWQIILIRREANTAADAISKKAHVERWHWSYLDALPRLPNLVQCL